MSSTFSRRRISLVTAAFSVGLLFFTFYDGFNDHQIKPLMVLGERNRALSASNRKLLGHTAATVEPNRAWGDKCTNSDIVVNQGPTAPLPNGIPTYTVEIMNVCSNGCDISNIHLSCGWFSSARLINPKVFKRVRYDDCIVNNGHTLANGGTVSFQYANTFPYPLSVSSVNC